MPNATTLDSCPAEFILSAAAPESPGKDARLLEQLKHQNRRALERVMRRYTAYVGTILRNITRGQASSEDIEELTADLDQTKPLFVMNHEPDELKEYDKAGVDVLFSGHTHAGQFFPLTIVQPFAWKNYWGVRQIGDMYSIVTSGVGVYGPNIRVGTDSEIMVVTVHFE